MYGLLSSKKNGRSKAVWQDIEGVDGIEGSNLKETHCSNFTFRLVPSNGGWSPNDDKLIERQIFVHILAQAQKKPESIQLFAVNFVNFQPLDLINPPFVSEIRATATGTTVTRCCSNKEIRAATWSRVIKSGGQSGIRRYLILEMSDYRSQCNGDSFR